MEVIKALCGHPEAPEQLCKRADPDIEISSAFKALVMLLLEVIPLFLFYLSLL